jgi:hypothetical protein
MSKTINSKNSVIKPPLRHGLNPCDRIETREAWSRLNRHLLHAIEAAPRDEALQISAFFSDLNMALHQKFGIQETK